MYQALSKIFYILTKKIFKDIFKTPQNMKYYFTDEKTESQKS